MKTASILFLLIPTLLFSSDRKLDTQHLLKALVEHNIFAISNKFDDEIDNIPAKLGKLDSYVEELNRIIDELMVNYYFEDNWKSSGSEIIYQRAVALSKLEYPGQTTRGLSYFHELILNHQIDMLEEHIVSIAKNVYANSNNPEDFSVWKKLWNTYRIE